MSVGAVRTESIAVKEAVAFAPPGGRGGLPFKFYVRQMTVNETAQAAVSSERLDQTGSDGKFVRLKKK